MHIKASGDMIQPKSSFDRTFNGSEIEGYIEAPTMFSYACGQQKPFYFFIPSETKDEAPKVKYGLSFDQLQVYLKTIFPPKTYFDAFYNVRRFNHS